MSRDMFAFMKSTMSRHSCVCSVYYYQQINRYALVLQYIFSYVLNIGDVLIL